MFPRQAQGRLFDGLGRSGGGDEFVVAPSASGRCALCWEAFRVGDPYKQVWQRGPRAGEVVLGITVHLACFGQLEAGDLTRVFGALARRLALPIAVLNGRRVALGRDEEPALSGAKGWRRGMSWRTGMRDREGQVAGVYWRGRRWRVAGGADEAAEGVGGEADAGGVGGELAAARARIAELEAASATSHQELAAARARLEELAAGAATQSAELALARQAAEAAAGGELDARRRALLAEHRGQVVDELVQGSTTDELEASVEVAQAAFRRVAEATRAAAAAEHVPAGAGARGAADLEALSPIQKIVRGLTK